MIEIKINNEEIPSEQKENVLLLNNNNKKSTLTPINAEISTNIRGLKNNIEEIK